MRQVAPASVELSATPQGAKPCLGEGVSSVACFGARILLTFDSPFLPLAGRPRGAPRRLLVGPCTAGSSSLLFLVAKRNIVN